MNAFSIALVVSSFVVTLTGDILLDRGVRQVVEQKGIDHLFSAGIDSLFQHSDAVVGNLECPATKIHAPVFKQYIFRAEPEWLNDLKRHGLTHLNLANNHSIDQGRKGLIDTKQNILQAGLIPIGAGQNQEEAAKPILLTEKPRKVWLIASLQLALENFPRLPDQPCVNQQSIDMLCQRIALMKQEDPPAITDTFFPYNDHRVDVTWEEIENLPEEYTGLTNQKQLRAMILSLKRQQDGQEIDKIIIDRIDYENASNSSE